MTRRWRVMRRPRLPKTCCSFPVVSAVLMRSPVEARRDGETAMQCSPAATGEKRSGGLGMNEPHQVIVHNVSKERQKKDKSDLHETLFEGHAEVAAQATFDGEKKNVAAVENGDG